MNSRRGTRRTSNRIFEAIADSSRREALRTLLTRDDPVTERELVADLVNVARRSEPSESVAERPSVHTDLLHTHLPVLADAGLISWDREAATVDTASHPAFDDPRFELILNVEADGLNDALANLDSERRRVLLTTLRDADGSMTRKDLARELLRSDDVDLEPSRDAIDDVIASLYHVDLPALDDADLIEYDPETSRATYADHPAIETVFTIIYEPDDSLVDSYDGFLSGLEAAYDALRRDTGTEAEWPHSWRDPSHG